MSETVLTKTYLLYYLEGGEKVPFYVGEALAPAQRFKQHVRDAADPLATKEAYVFLREHSIADFFYEEVPATTEAALVTELVLAGYRLYNSNAGIKSGEKKRKVVSEFTRQNRDAEERIERRTVLHGPTQALSKSEIVAARITGHVPTVIDLMGADWSPTDPGILGQDVQRTGTRAEVLRWGDYRFLIAYRPQGKHQDAEVSAVVENRRNGTELRASGWWMKRIPGAAAKKQKILEYLLRIWLDPTVDSWSKP